MIKRTLYLGYYFKQMKWDVLKKFLTYASKVSNRSKFSLALESIRDVYKYNISILEYFQFGFYNKTDDEKKKWAGTGYMYEYQLVMNPKEERIILDDKRKFFKSYEKYVSHIVADLNDLKNNKKTIQKLLNNPAGKIVFKSSDGKCGAGVKVEETKNFDEKTILTFMLENEYDLVEEFIIQHPLLNSLSPSGVNTVRIFTQLDENNEVVLLGCRQRISVNSPIDNLAAGNLAANIDEKTGII